MFREIRTREKNLETLRKQEEERKRLEEHGYLSIKPETDITVEECRALWDSVFYGLKED
jgi:hypothetical protein